MKTARDRKCSSHLPFVCSEPCSCFRAQEDVSLEMINLLNAKKQYSINQRDKCKQEVNTACELH